MVAQRRKRKAPAAVLGDADVREGTVVTVDTAKCKGLRSKPDGPWPVENAQHVDDEFLASIRGDETYKAVKEAVVDALDTRAFTVRAPQRVKENKPGGQLRVRPASFYDPSRAASPRLPRRCDAVIALAVAWLNGVPIAMYVLEKRVELLVKYALNYVGSFSLSPAIRAFFGNGVKISCEYMKLTPGASSAKAEAAGFVAMAVTLNAIGGTDLLVQRPLSKCYMSAAVRRALLHISRGEDEDAAERALAILETPEGGPLPAFKVWSDAARADHSKKLKKAQARPEVKAARSSATAKAARSAAATAAHARPEVKAAMSAAATAAAARPATKAKKSKSMLGMWAKSSFVASVQKPCVHCGALNWPRTRYCVSCGDQCSLVWRNLNGGGGKSGVANMAKSIEISYDFSGRAVGAKGPAVEFAFDKTPTDHVIESADRSRKVSFKPFSLPKDTKMVVTFGFK